MSTDKNTNDFEALPKRIFLDSSTLQTLHTYREIIYDGQPNNIENKMWRENIESLRNIFLVQSRAYHEFALSENSFVEVGNKGDASYLQWAFEMLDYWQSCINRYKTALLAAKGVAQQKDLKIRNLVIWELRTATSYGMR